MASGSEWNRQHRERLRALPLAALKKLRPTAFTIYELRRRKTEEEVKKGLRLPRANARPT